MEYQVNYLNISSISSLVKSLYLPFSRLPISNLPTLILSSVLTPNPNLFRILAYKPNKYIV